MYAGVLINQVQISYNYFGNLVIFLFKHLLNQLPLETSKIAQWLEIFLLKLNVLGDMGSYNYIGFKDRIL